jgi:NAD(P)-dependent dehydrogenase (short-subunit alcohol dehydrogenase family)
MKAGTYPLSFHGEFVSMLSDKVAIVTGGATGIGKAISLSLAKSGARVAICSRGRPHLDIAAAEFKTAELPVLPLQVDVCDKKQIQIAVAKVMAKMACRAHSGQQRGDFRINYDRRSR